MNTLKLTLFAGLGVLSLSALTGALNSASATEFSRTTANQSQEQVGNSDRHTGLNGRHNCAHRHHKHHRHHHNHG